MADGAMRAGATTTGSSNYSVSVSPGSRTPLRIMDVCRSHAGPAAAGRWLAWPVAYSSPSTGGRPHSHAQSNHATSWSGDPLTRIKQEALYL